MHYDEPQGDAAGPAVESGGAATPQPEGAPDDGRHLLEPWSDQEEVHAVPEILGAGEAIMAVGSGTVLRTGRLAQSRWLVLVTAQRILCIKGRVAASRKVIEMPISAIKSVARTGLFRKTLVLHVGVGTLRITSIKGDVAARLVDALTTLSRAHREEAGAGG